MYPEYLDTATGMEFRIMTENDELLKASGGRIVLSKKDEYLYGGKYFKERYWEKLLMMRKLK